MQWVFWPSFPPDWHCGNLPVHLESGKRGGKKCVTEQRPEVEEYFNSTLRWKKLRGKERKWLLQSHNLSSNNFMPLVPFFHPALTSDACRLWECASVRVRAFVFSFTVYMFQFVLICWHMCYLCTCLLVHIHYIEECGYVLPLSNRGLWRFIYCTVVEGPRKGLTGSLCGFVFASGTYYPIPG